MHPKTISPYLLALAAAIALFALPAAAQATVCVNHAGTPGGYGCQATYNNIPQALASGLPGPVWVAADGPYTEPVTTRGEVDIIGGGASGIQATGQWAIGNAAEVQRVSLAKCPTLSSEPEGIEVIASTLPSGCNLGGEYLSRNPYYGHWTGSGEWRVKVESAYPDRDQAAYNLGNEELWGKCLPAPYIPPNPCLAYEGEWEP